MHNQNRLVPYLFILPGILGLFLFRIVPIVIAVVGSFTSQSLTGETALAGFRNYVELFADPAFWVSFRLTIFFNLLINPIQVLLAFGLALLVFRQTPGVGWIRTFCFLPMTVSIAITSILWNLMLDPSYGLVNGILRSGGLAPQPFFTSASQALPSLIWLASWKGVGYWMIFLLAGLNDIPAIYYEAAQIDGASFFDQFRHITLPLMRRPLAFVLVADTVANFLFFAPVYLITRGGPLGTTSLLMFTAYQNAFTYGDLGRSLAISTFILGIIIVFAFFEFQFFRSEDHAYA